ncbi:MAG: hypothetical protein D6738_02645 [Acidobacteria bacterium]|nr:MAG: hypothetical protein D6738_02645 [Acidobacteriota bacterium]
MPALIGGGVAGFVSALPLIGALNCLCCSLVIGGGVLAAWLQSNECRKAGVPFTAGSGAMVGLIAGLFFAVVASVVATVIQSLMPSADPAQVLEMLESQGTEVPPFVRSLLESMGGGAGFGVRLVFTFAVDLVLGAIFATIGGLLGGMFFKHEPATAGPAPGSPPPAPGL